MTNLENKLWERKLRQKDLVKLTGKNCSTVCVHVKKGIKTIRVARRYAKILKCDPKELLD